ncbi:MAG: EamA family transporter [Acidobacteria bacterium]|nr:EamA family transporter [Acidobacteriota bacterium]
MTSRKYLVLALIVVFASSGNTLLSVGMRHGPDQKQGVSVHHLGQLILSFANPWVICGTLLLIGFLTMYMTALSWADLTYVLPATSLGYVAVALIGRFVLKEHITPLRWAGIALITVGVGFVTRGRSHTPQKERMEEAERRSQ